MEACVTALLALEDSPLWSAGEYRGVVSRIDALFGIREFVTGPDLESFFFAAECVLSETDSNYRPRWRDDASDAGRSATHEQLHEFTRTSQVARPRSHAAESRPVGPDARGSCRAASGPARRRPVANMGPHRRWWGDAEASTTRPRPVSASEFAVASSFTRKLGAVVATAFRGEARKRTHAWANI